jgi:hypothetical protein
MGRKSLTGGVIPMRRRIRFDFRVAGVRFRPTLPWPPTEGNLRRARAYLARINAQIEAGTFCFADAFPHYRRRHDIPIPLTAQSRDAVFDAFLDHESARVARGDLAPSPWPRIARSSIASGGPHIGPLPFLGVRHSQLLKIADAQRWKRKTYNNAISALRRAFAFGYCDYPHAPENGGPHHLPHKQLRIVEPYA